MRLTIVALALANVAALPVPKASFLRGAREDEDTSSTHREGGRHVSFGRYAETPTPAPTYWASAVVGQAPPLSALPQDSQACQDAVASIDEIPSCDDVGLNNQGLCKADPATTACSLPAGDSCVVTNVGDDPQRRLQAGSVVSVVGHKGGVDAFYCFASYLGLANTFDRCASCCGGCTKKNPADGTDFSGLPAGECVCFEGALSGNSPTDRQVVTLTNSNDCALVTGNNLEIRVRARRPNVPRAVRLLADGGIPRRAWRASMRFLSPATATTSKFAPRPRDLPPLSTLVLPQGNEGDDVLYATGDSNWLYVCTASSLPTALYLVSSSG